ncbi:MAG: 3-carboxy-cis,cis-muconate cycloisomerase [Tepidiformaceae bacterium]
MPSDPLFASMFSTPEMSALVSGRAWLQAMLDVEAALARAQAKAGLVSVAAAAQIAAACDTSAFDMEAIGREALTAGNPVLPLVAMLRRALPPAAADALHRGPTSQDILDTAAMLISRRALDAVLAAMARVESSCVRLAAEHRRTVMPGRTLLRQAVPITFGLKAAGWLSGCLEAHAALASYRQHRLAIQLGGAAGTLAAMGPEGPAVLRSLAHELGLHEPLLPWHTARARIAELGAALGLASGAAGKVALDLLLLAQDEVGEVTWPAAGTGRSSAMPHKRNPVAAVAAIACVRRAHALVPLLFGAMLQEHERAAGAWQAEWETVSDLFGLTHAALSHVADALESLQVHPAAMRANVRAGGGLMMTESAVEALAARIGPGPARELVDDAVSRALDSGTTLREALLADETVRAQLSVKALDDALSPDNYLGSAGYFIDRVLAAHAQRDWAGAAPGEGAP